MKDILKRKGGFYSSSIYTNVGTVCINASAVFTEQRIQLEQEAKENTERLQKKIDVWIKKLQYAIKASTKILKGEEFKSGGTEECSHVCIVSL